jgi:hypothetical protein
MKPIMLGAMFAALMTSAAVAQTPSWLPPLDSARCPSRWGAGDERGAANHMGPASVLKAASLIKTGEVIELSHPLHAQMPLSPGRVYDMQLKRTAIGGLANKRNGNEELIVAEMGQSGRSSTALRIRPSTIATTTASGPRTSRHAPGSPSSASRRSAC